MPLYIKWDGRAISSENSGIKQLWELINWFFKGIVIFQKNITMTKIGVENVSHRRARLIITPHP